MAKTQRSLAKRLWYVILRYFLRLLGIVFYRVRVRGREFVPRDGGVLVLCNHQSHLDPMLVGLACDRRLNYLARDTLFRFLPFRWLIQSLDAIPLDREGLGLSGLKETLRRLKSGELVLIFPEGTRSRTGEIARLKPGFCSVARRGKVSLLPMAIAGAFAAWPRTTSYPMPGVIHIQFGPAISPELVAACDDDALVAEVDRRIRACHATAQETRDRTRR